LVDFLQFHGKCCQGFYTEEVREKHERIGFDVVTVPDGKRGILARKSPKFKSKFRTGRYFVDVNSFEKLALPSLTISSQSKRKSDDGNNDKQSVSLGADEVDQDKSSLED
jgi:nucleoside-triphosphatase THEP1